MEKNRSTVKKNIVYYFVYNILTILIPLVLSPFLSRTLGVQALGLYSFTLAIANYFKRFSMLGMEKYANRSIALVKNNKLKERETFWGIYKIQFLCSLLCLIAYAFYLHFWNNEGTSAVLQYIFILSATFDVSWYYFGNERFKPVIFFSSVAKIIYLIFTFILVNSSSDVDIYIVLSALSYLIPNVITFMMAVIKEKYTRNSISELKNILKGTLILFIPVIAVTLYKSMDKVMLGFLSATTFENGLYENAEKIMHVPIAVIAAISAVMLPRMTKLYRDNMNSKAKAYIEKSMQYSSVISVGMAFGIAGVSNIFSTVFWGSIFSDCAILLKMFAISIPFMSFAEIIRTQYIIPKKKDIIYVKAVCLGALINFLINFALIPQIGARGAVIGTIIAEAVVCIYQTIKVRNELRIIELAKSYFFLIPAGVITGIILFLINLKLPYNIVNLILIIMVGAFLYCLTALITIFFFDKGLWNELKNYLFFMRKKYNVKNDKQ